MRQRLRTTISLLAGVLLVAVALAPAPASAATPDEVSRAIGWIGALPGGPRAVVASDTGWTEAYTGFEAGGGACGGIVLGSQKDGTSSTREQRTLTYRNGDVVTQWRGSVTLSVRRTNNDLPSPEPPKKFFDVVVGGAVIRVDYASGAVFLDRKAPGVVLVHTSEFAPGPERTAFIEAGLPSVYVLKKGSFTEYLSPRTDVLSIIRRSTTQLVNACDVIGEAEWRDSTVLVYDSSGIGDPIYRP